MSIKLKPITARWCREGPRVKVLLTCHRDPWGTAAEAPLGGVERTVQRLADGLVQRGHAVVVVSGTLDSAVDPIPQAVTSRPSGGFLTRVSIRRADLHHDHWQKSLSARAGRQFEELVAAERPDVVHVHHWLRLSRDLVLRAARQGVPSLVTLHDHFVSCPLTFRVQPQTMLPCDKKSGLLPCVACADSVPPIAHWLPMEARWTEFTLRRHDLVRELKLARVITVPTQAHAQALRAYLAPELDSLSLSVLPHPAPAVTRSPQPQRHSQGHMGSLRVLVLGRLAREKGLEVVFAALELCAARASIELHLLGTTGDESTQAWLAARLTHVRSLAGVRVQLHGAYDAAELGTHPVLQHTDLIALPSLASESQGLVLDEALQLGRPCVLSSLPAYRERVAARSAQGCCLWVPPGDAAALAAHWVDLAHNPQRFDALAKAVPAHKDARQEEAVWLDAHQALYDQCLSAGAAPTPASGEAWFEERMRTFAESQWDAALARSTRAQLGYDA